MLEVQGLTVAYGQHQALTGATVRVGKGEIVVILGANGAGKSSLLKAVSGISEGRVGGSVTLDGIDLAGKPPHRIVEEGIALVPEGRGVFPDLSVEENLTLGSYARRARDEEAASLENVYALFPKLRERRRQVVRTMSGGEQQMVAIGRAMMSNPQILTLDEPSLGLSPLLCKDLFQSLKKVRATGIGILLVEQNAKQSLAIADRGYLLENGRIVHEAQAADLIRDPAVQKAYLGGGGKSAAAVPRPAAAPKPVSEAARRPTPVGPSPAEIAAQAVARVAAPPRPVPAAPPAPPLRAPEPPRPVAPPPRPVAAPVAARPAPGGIDIGALVSKAATTSRAGLNGRGTGRTPTPPPAPPIGTAPGLPRSAPSLPPTPMPDLAATGDRLKSILAEIEEAAARARAYRPPGSRS